MNGLSDGYIIASMLTTLAALFAVIEAGYLARRAWAWIKRDR